MKKATSILILFLLTSLSAFAQRPGAVADTSVYRINENDVKRFILAHNKMNLTQADFDWMNAHPYEGNENSEVYLRIKKSITAAGFKDYLEYSKVAQRVTTVYAYTKNGGISEEEQQQMEEAVNNPAIPDQYKETIRQQVEAIKRQKPTETESQVIKVHQKELDDLLAKFQDEG